jgi:hypothetical protein
LLAETKQEFVKTRADLTKKLDDLSTKLKGILILDLKMRKSPNAKIFFFYCQISVK